jgi:hypothetical protein
VIGDQFAHNQEKNVVVALENDITMATKNQFVTPKKLGFDRNTIVNSPW